MNRKSRGPEPEVTWTGTGCHVDRNRQSRGPGPEVTWTGSVIFFPTLVPGSINFQLSRLSGLGYGLGLGFWVVITIIVSQTLTLTLTTTLTVILP